MVLHELRTVLVIASCFREKCKICINIDILSGKTDTGAKPDEGNVAGWLQCDRSLGFTPNLTELTASIGATQVTLVVKD